eukprot:1683467-Karenia_brevis.AAC.1
MSDVAVSNKLCDFECPEPYLDPMFKNYPRKYGNFLKDLKSRKLIRWSTYSHCTLGLFFVRKKNGRQRMIVDARPLNFRCAEPPHVALATGDSFSRLEVSA